MLYFINILYKYDCDEQVDRYSKEVNIYSKNLNIICSYGYMKITSASFKTGDYLYYDHAWGTSLFRLFSKGSN